MQIGKYSEPIDFTFLLVLWLPEARQDRTSFWIRPTELFSLEKRDALVEFLFSTFVWHILNVRNFQVKFVVIINRHTTLKLLVHEERWHTSNQWAPLCLSPFFAQTLTYLNLQENRIGDSGAQHLAEGLKNNQVKLINFRDFVFSCSLILFCYRHCRLYI